MALPAMRFRKQLNTIRKAFFRLTRCSDKIDDFRRCYTRNVSTLRPRRNLANLLCTSKPLSLKDTDLQKNIRNFFRTTANASYLHRAQGEYLRLALYNRLRYCLPLNTPLADSTNTQPSESAGYAVLLIVSLSSQRLTPCGPSAIRTLLIFPPKSCVVHASFAVSNLNFSSNDNFIINPEILFIRALPLSQKRGCSTRRHRYFFYMVYASFALFFSAGVVRFIKIFRQTIRYNKAFLRAVQDNFRRLFKSHRFTCVHAVIFTLSSYAKASV